MIGVQKFEDPLLSTVLEVLKSEKEFEFGVYDLVLLVEGLGFRAEGLELQVHCLGIRFHILTQSCR